MPSATIWWSNCAVPSLNTIAEWKYASCNRALHILWYPDYSLWKHKLLLWGIKLCLLQNRDKSSTCISDKHSNHWFRTTQSFLYIQNFVQCVAIIIISILCWILHFGKHLISVFKGIFFLLFSICLLKRRSLLFDHTCSPKESITFSNLIFKSISTRKCFIIDKIILSGKIMNHYLSWTIFQEHYNDSFYFSGKYG